MSDAANRFVWYELATTDAEAAKAFYASVMGWGVANAGVPGSNYVLFTAGGEPVAGLVELPPAAAATGAAPQWLGYIAVDDVDAAAHGARKLGGSLLVPPTDVPNVSRFSVIADPQAAALALIKGRGRGRERKGQPVKPGRVSWRELHTTDLEKAFDFYRGLLGWERADANASFGEKYWQFSAGGEEAIGGMLIKQENSPAVWLYYFNVPDIEGASKRVQAAGGELRYGPVTVEDGARIANCTDPQGSLFGLIESHLFVAVGCYRSRSSRPG